LGVGGIGVVSPPETARALGSSTPDSLANYKNWNREPAFLQLQWSKTIDGGWWLFDQVSPKQLDAHGVFVVWRNGNPVQAPAVIYVGRGSLRDEFARCRRDPVFRSEGVYVTWAAVQDVASLDAIAAFLYRELRPIWGEVVPLVPPVPCNLPLTA
jgi:hypothetical protein